MLSGKCSLSLRPNDSDVRMNRGQRAAGLGVMLPFTSILVSKELNDKDFTKILFRGRTKQETGSPRVSCDGHLDALFITCFSFITTN